MRNIGTTLSLFIIHKSNVCFENKKKFILITLDQGLEGLFALIYEMYFIRHVILEINYILKLAIQNF